VFDYDGTKWDIFLRAVRHSRTPPNGAVTTFMAWDGNRLEAPVVGQLPLMLFFSFSIILLVLIYLVAKLWYNSIKLGGW